MANTSSSRIDLTRGTGPQGHRARMRTRVETNGAETLADEAAPPEEDITFLNRAIAIRALALHATAIIGVHVQPALRAPALSTAARTLENALRPLSIVLHDVLISTKTATLSSLRQEGLL